jgi:hypothetical protein
MLHRINTLNKQPAFYGTLDYNCTSSLRRMGKELWPDKPRVEGLRSLLTGLAAEHAYFRGKIASDLTFEDLKKRCFITPDAQGVTDEADFSRRIRETVL